MKLLPALTICLALSYGVTADLLSHFQQVLHGMDHDLTDVSDESMVLGHQLLNSLGRSAKTLVSNAVHELASSLTSTTPVHLPPVRRTLSKIAEVDQDLQRTIKSAVEGLQRNFDQSIYKIQHTLTDADRGHDSTIVHSINVIFDQHNKLTNDIVEEMLKDISLLEAAMPELSLKGKRSVGFPAVGENLNGLLSSYVTNLQNLMGTLTHSLSHSFMSLQTAPTDWSSQMISHLTDSLSSAGTGSQHNQQENHDQHVYINFPYKSPNLHDRPTQPDNQLPDGYYSSQVHHSSQQHNQSPPSALQIDPHTQHQFKNPMDLLAYLDNHSTDYQANNQLSGESDQKQPSEATAEVPPSGTDIQSTGSETNPYSTDPLTALTGLKFESPNHEMSSQMSGNPKKVVPDEKTNSKTSIVKVKNHGTDPLVGLEFQSTDYDGDHDSTASLPESTADVINNGDMEF